MTTKKLTPFDAIAELDSISCPVEQNELTTLEKETLKCLSRLEPEGMVAAMKFLVDLGSTSVQNGGKAI